jgi:hypothetical protein
MKKIVLLLAVVLLFSFSGSGITQNINDSSVLLVLPFIVKKEKKECFDACKKEKQEAIKQCIETKQKPLSDCIQRAQERAKECLNSNCKSS